MKAFFISIFSKINYFFLFSLLNEIHILKDGLLLDWLIDYCRGFIKSLSTADHTAAIFSKSLVWSAYLNTKWRMEWNNDYKIMFFLFAFCPKKKLLPINLKIEKDNFYGIFFLYSNPIKMFLIWISEYELCLDISIITKHHQILSQKKSLEIE